MCTTSVPRNIRDICLELCAVLLPVGHEIWCRVRRLKTIVVIDLETLAVVISTVRIDDKNAPFTARSQSHGEPVSSH